MVCLIYIEYITDKRPMRGESEAMLIVLTQNLGKHAYVILPLSHMIGVSPQLRSVPSQVLRVNRTKSKESASKVPRRKVKS